MSDHTRRGQAKHTPGPWRLVDERTSEGRLHRLEVYGPTGCGRGGKPIALIPHGFRDNEANARLIAAAPAYAAEAYNLLFAWEHDSETTPIVESIERLRKIHFEATGEVIP